MNELMNMGAGLLTTLQFFGLKRDNVDSAQDNRVLEVKICWK